VDLLGEVGVDAQLLLLLVEVVVFSTARSFGGGSVTATSFDVMDEFFLTGLPRLTLATCTRRRVGDLTVDFRLGLHQLRFQGRMEGNMKRIVGAVIALVATLGFGAAIAAAYPVGDPEITVSDSSPLPGGQLTVNASEFCAGDTVTLTIVPDGSEVGQLTADGNGNVAFVITAPAAVGTYVLTASGTNCRDTFASSTINVVQPGGIPRTGNDSGSTLQLGAIVVAAGAALLGVAALRRRRPTPA